MDILASKQIYFKSVSARPQHLHGKTFAKAQPASILLIKPLNIKYVWSGNQKKFLKG
jgi:hypothetical protein